MRRALAIAALLAALPAVAPAPASAQQRARWNTKLLARIQRPGYPAFAYVHPNGRIYVGTYTNTMGDTLRSRVFEFTDEGTLLRSWTVPGQNLTVEHGVQVTTSDARGRLVLLDRAPARALQLDTRTGEFRQYATFADLPACPGAAPAPGCSPTQTDMPPMANYGVWGPEGSLYVTDFLQGVVWRVPPGGGAAQVWLSDHRLDGNEFGTTGIALSADRRTLLIAQGSSGGGGEPNPTTGKLYAADIRPDGSPGPLRRLWESGPADLPDGFAIARSGKVYVPLAGGANQIAVLAPDGTELERFPSQSGPGDNGSPVPFDTPSGVRFLGTRLIVANQSFTGTTANQAILDVEAGETGQPELIPANAGLADAVAPVFARVRILRGARRVRFSLSEAATATIALERLRARRYRFGRLVYRGVRAGTSTVTFSPRRLRPGRYRLVLRASDSSENVSRRVLRRFRVRG